MEPQDAATWNARGSWLEAWSVLAIDTHATLGVKQGAAGIRRAAPRGRRRAEVDGCDGGRSEVNWQPKCSLAGGVMSPAGTRGCVSRWFDTGCATMLES